MLTRIGIRGFKAFQDFSLDLGPFLSRVGPNASGKSNLFDGIRLLSRLAAFDLRTAVKRLEAALQAVVGRRRGRQRRAAEFLDVIGERVSLVRLREVPAFRLLERELRAALKDLRYIDGPEP